MNIGNTFFGAAVKFQNVNSVSQVVSVLLNIAFVIAGISLLILFIVSGIGLISSAGDSDPQKTEQAKKSITSAVIGFIVVFASYWIVKLIGQLVGIPNLI